MSEGTSTVLAEAINDLTRVTLALNSNGASKAELIRRLASAAVKPARIASLLSIPTKDVTSALNKHRKANGRGGGKATTRA